MKEKHLTNQLLFNNKEISGNRTKNLLNMIKDIKKKYPTANIILNGERLNTFLKIRCEARIPTFTTAISTLEVQAEQVRREKKV